MKLHMLGVNGPFPQSGGATSGYLLEAGETLIQFDLGSGVLSRLTAKTAPESVSALFLTHWHFDHAADLPVLMYRLDQLGDHPLPVYAPADPDSAIRRIVAASPRFSLKDVSSGDEISVGSCTVRVGEARHPVPAVGYRIESDGVSFGYTGDTNTLPGLSAFYRGCRVLLADGLFPESEWTAQKPHLSAAGAAMLAAEAGAEHVVLTHFNPVYPPEQLLQEARMHHAHVSLARPGEVLDL